MKSSKFRETAYAVFAVTGEAMTFFFRRAAGHDYNSKKEPQKKQYKSFENENFLRESHFFRSQGSFARHIL